MMIRFQERVLQSCSFSSVILFFMIQKISFSLFPISKLLKVNSVNYMKNIEK